MSLTLKKSRRIVVGQQGYRFQISTTKTDEACNFNLNLSIQAEHGKGALLKVTGLRTRHFWLDYPVLLHAEYKAQDYPALQPKHIARVIKLALQAGWQAMQPGKVFQLRLTNTELFGAENLS